MDRQTPEQERAQAAQEALHTLADPAVQRAFGRLEKGLVDLIAYGDHVTMKDWREEEAELCRKIRTLRGLRQDLFSAIPPDHPERGTLSRLWTKATTP